MWVCCKLCKLCTHSSCAFYACEPFWHIPRVKSYVSKGNAGACFATQPSAELLQSIIMAWLSTVDDVTLIAIFEHFANCYVSMPIVGTCRRIFITWTRKRRQIALGELARLQSWLDEEELRTVRLLNVSHQELRRIGMDGRVVSHASCEICQAIRVVRRFA